MLQTISPLELRQQTGAILDKVLYRKDRYLIRRKNKPLAVLVPYDEYQQQVPETFGEDYTDERIAEFLKADRLTAKQRQTVTEIGQKLGIKLEV